MKAKTILLSLVLLAATITVAPQTKHPSTTGGLVLNIYLHGWATATGTEAYVAGRPISIRAVWKNTGDRPMSFLLKDHDPYHGTLGFPMFLWARVTDSSGTVLTRTDAAGVGRDGWWAASTRGCDFFVDGSEMPGDIITLKPGQEVTRIVPLHEVLAGLNNLPDGLSPGTYIVEFRHSDTSKGINTISNRLVIKVVADK